MGITDGLGTPFDKMTVRIFGHCLSDIGFTWALELKIPSSRKT